MRRYRTEIGWVYSLAIGAVGIAFADPAPLDPNHPPHLGAEYYPPESAQLHEEGTCRVRLRVAADGTTHDITLTLSTGYARLDAACMNAFADGGLLPATENGKPIDKIFEIPIIWILPPVKPSPRLDPKNPPRIGEAYYPAESRRRGEEGTCKVSMTIKADGKIGNIVLTKSTGYARLDEACLKAFVHGGLLPPVVDGKPIESTFEIPIAWVLTTKTSL